MVDKYNKKIKKNPKEMVIIPEQDSMIDETKKEEKVVKLITKAKIDNSTKKKPNKSILSPRERPMTGNKTVKKK